MVQVGESDFTQTMLDKGALFSRCATPSKLNMFNFVNIVFFAFFCHTCKLLSLKAAVFKESRQRWQEAAHLQCGQTREGGLPQYTIPSLGPWLPYHTIPRLPNRNIQGLGPRLPRHTIPRLPHHTIPRLTHHTIPRLPHHTIPSYLTIPSL